MTQIAVIGMSSFGYYLARTLSEKGAKVLVIDMDVSKIDNVKGYVTKAVVGDATDIRVLKQLGVMNMDSVVISLGSKLDSSILVAMHLKELEVKNVVAKAMTEDHAKILDIIGVKRVVFPEKDMGVRIAHSLLGSNIADYVTLSSELSIAEVIPLKEMIGKTLIDLHFRKKYHCQVLAIKAKDNGESVFIPDANTIIEEKQLLILLGREQDLVKLNH
jgi:trk system potassium uptake protein